MLSTLGRMKPILGHACVSAARQRRSRLRLRSSLEPLEVRQLLATDGLSSKLGHAALAADLFDPHQDLHALKKAPKPAMTASVVVGPDTRGAVTVSGQTRAKAKVKLDIGADGSIEQTVKADAKGRFQFTFAVGFGATPVRLTLAQKGKRPPSALLVVIRTVLPPPDNSPPTVMIVGLAPAPLARTNATISGRVASGRCIADNVPYPPHRPTLRSCTTLTVYVSYQSRRGALPGFCSPYRRSETFTKLWSRELEAQSS
jgi:hypothetical protein